MSTDKWHLRLPDKKWHPVFLLIPVVIYLVILISSLTTGPKIFNPKGADIEASSGTRKALPKALRKHDEVKGFSLKSDQDDKLSASLKAESYSVENKKMGVFRMGLLTEGRIKNLELNLFNHSQFFREENSPIIGNVNLLNDRLMQPMAAPENNRTSLQSDAVSDPSDNAFSSGMVQGTGKTLSPQFGEEMKALFAQVINKGTSGVKIHSWVIENFAMNIYSGDKTLLSTIRSDSAVMGGTGSSIRFKGNFTISVQNGKTLIASRAIYLIPRNVFQVSAPYSIDPGVRKDEGILEVDAFLERLSQVY